MTLSCRNGVSTLLQDGSWFILNLRVMFSRSRAIFTAVFLTALVPVLAAGAQRDSPSGRGSFGVHFQVSEPKGDFARNTNNGWGLGAYALGSLDPNSIANLRGDISFVNYANSRRRIPMSGTGGLIQLDLKTSSNIFTFVAGPQLLGPTGTFSPYATALAGFSVFSTQSTIEGSDYEDEPFASTTNASDVAFAYGGAVGAYLRVSNGTYPARIDFGARFLRHDNASYLNDQRVKEAFENDRPPVPVRGRADFMTYYLGVNIIAF